MPWRLILSIIAVILVVTFIGFNLNDTNKCDISFVFFTIYAIPVYMIVLVSLLIGMLLMLSLAFSFIRKRTKQSLVSASKRMTSNKESTYSGSVTDIGTKKMDLESGK